MQLKILDFLLLDRKKQGDDVKIRKEDYKFTDLKNHSQNFPKRRWWIDLHKSILCPWYPYDRSPTRAKSRIESSFSTLVGAKKDDILKHSSITDYQGNKVAITDVEVDEAGKKVTYIGDFSDTQHPYTVKATIQTALPHVQAGASRMSPTVTMVHSAQL